MSDVGIYGFDTARFLTGDEPVELTASQYTTPDDRRLREVRESVAWAEMDPAFTYGGLPLGVFRRSQWSALAESP